MQCQYIQGAAAVRCTLPLSTLLQCLHWCDIAGTEPDIRAERLVLRTEGRVWDALLHKHKEAERHSSCFTAMRGCEQQQEDKRQLLKHMASRRNKAEVQL
ncbi:uncharacterized protein ACO6RY_08129 [Pungitius sinensis]